MMISFEVHEETLVEDVICAPCTVEIETGAMEQAEAIEPLIFGLHGAAPSFETRVKIPVALAAEPQESEAPKEESSTSGSIVSQAELVEAKGKITSLKDTSGLQQVQYRLLRDRNLQLEEVLRTSVRAMDIAPALEGKYWDSINLCRQVMRLLRPQFPTAVFNPPNASATCSGDLYGLPGKVFFSPSRPGPSSGPQPFGQPGSPE
ncbi:hypothetical protein Nepgr_005940 [Nepenthes gracilis]|uniref:Uncharacterized protein n=1 Tax=Nepenthes gracilis TaxID=150966 RepID=A0AAD3S4H2_NEPGR|nr:hypothetical protein Nepgr_005940 [Nepenthes gracilis]